MRRLSLLVPCLAVALFGFGCKDPDYGTVPRATNWRGVIQDTPPPRGSAPTGAPPKATQKLFDTVRAEPTELPLLRQALANLAAATSFKAVLTLPPADGQSDHVKGELSFDRSHGFRGIITLNPQTKSEVLVLDNQIYFRANTSSWQTITHTDEGDRLRLFFQVAFPSQSRPNQLLVSDSTRILESKADERGCQRYTYTEVLPNGDTAKTVLCVKDGFPTYIINEYAEGETEVSYTDINQPVDIGGLR
jgi:hypothetical protein